MKYSYLFERDSFGFLMIKLPKKIELFSHFIEEIVTEEDVNLLIDLIDKIVAGTYKEKEVTFDSPTVLIQPDITSVSLSDILDNPPPDQYIETDEFRKLILIWQEKSPVRFINKDDVH